MHNIIQPRFTRSLSIRLFLALSLFACSNAEPPTKDAVATETTVRTVKITTATSQTRNIDVVEQALGRILDPASTTVAAEVPARVIKVLVDVGDRVGKGDLLAQLDTSDMQVAVSTAEASLARNKAQAIAQKRLVQRYRELAKNHFVSTTMLDQAEAQWVVLKKSIKASAAQLKQTNINLARTNIIAPIAANVQKRFVADGDYIGLGKPMFQLVTNKQLIISIAIPETQSQTIRAGLPVRMHLPNSHEIIAAVIDDVTPMIGSASNAFQARVKTPNPGHWRAGGSVIAELITATHKQAVVVPEECVVLRPAGEVVYLIKANTVEMRRVHTGVRKHGYIEITDGLQAGLTLAATGASFLSDGANIQIQDTQIQDTQESQQ